MKGSFLLMLRLLFYRPLVVVLLLLFYAVGAFFLVIIDSPQRALPFAIMEAIAAAGCAAILTERISRFSLSAGTLGIPDHARIMRLVQGWFLLLFAVFPAALELACGMGIFQCIALCTVAIAIGVALARYGAWIFVVPVAAQLLPRDMLFQSAPLQLGLALLAAWIVWRWFELPEAAERAATLAPTALADAQHELTENTTVEHAGQLEAEGSSAAVDALIETASVELRSGLVSPRMLSIGLGYDSGTQWRAVGYGIVVGVAAIALGRRVWLSAFKPYVVVTFYCCFALVGRLQQIISRWMHTPTEQSLLRLAPRWPPELATKKTVLRTVVSVQRGAMAAWLLISLLSLQLGWITFNMLLLGALGMVMASIASSSAALATLSRNRVPEISLYTILIALTVVVGAGLLLLAPEHGLGWAGAGAVLMILPPAVIVPLYLRRPLRMPLEVDPRALKRVRF